MRVWVFARHVGNLDSTTGKLYQRMYEEHLLYMHKRTHDTPFGAFKS